MALVLDGDNGIVGVLATNADGDVIIDTSTFFVDAPNNRVGIGQISPASKLDVHNNSVNYARIGTSYSGHYFESQSDDNTDGFEIYQQHGSNTTRNSFIVNDNRTGSKSAALLVRGDGNVGIGTDSPATTLDTGYTRVYNSGAAISPAAGKGLEVHYVTSGRGQGEGAYLISYDRDNSAYKQFTIDAESINLVASGTTALNVTAGHVGVNVTPGSGTLEVFGKNDTAGLLVTNNDLTHTSNAYYAHRNNRVLTSNGTNWAADGRDPALVVGGHNDGTDKGEGLGILLHNESPNDDTFSPGLFFTNKSNSGIYNTAYGYIMGRKKGQGVDANWSTGEVWIDTAGTKHNGNNQYMDDSPAIRVRQTGTVDMRWQAFSYGTLAGNTHQTQQTGWSFSPLLTQGLNYNNNASHGWGFTVNEEGYYECMATGLYTPGTSGYVYLGWAINGTHVHHWHSNHVVESNHDFVSHMTRWCNVGDHLTIEHNHATVGYQWGGTHSQYSIWKVG